VLLHIAIDFSAAAEADIEALMPHNPAIDGVAVHLAYNRPIERLEMFSAFYDTPQQGLSASAVGTSVEVTFNTSKRYYLL
jgi:hypothetical protein